ASAAMLVIQRLPAMPRATKARERRVFIISSRVRELISRWPLPSVRPNFSARHSARGIGTAELRHRLDAPPQNRVAQNLSVSFQPALFVNLPRHYRRAARKNHAIAAVFGAC